VRQDHLSSPPRHVVQTNIPQEPRHSRQAFQPKPTLLGAIPIRPANRVRILFLSMTFIFQGQKRRLKPKVIEAPSTPFESEAPTQNPAFRLQSTTTGPQPQTLEPELTPPETTDSSTLGAAALIEQRLTSSVTTSVVDRLPTPAERKRMNEETKLKKQNRLPPQPKQPSEPTQVTNANADGSSLLHPTHPVIIDWIVEVYSLLSKENSYLLTQLSLVRPLLSHQEFLVRHVLINSSSQC